MIPYNSSKLYPDGVPGCGRFYIDNPELAKGIPDPDVRYPWEKKLAATGTVMVPVGHIDDNNIEHLPTRRVKAHRQYVAAHS